MTPQEEKLNSSDPSSKEPQSQQCPMPIEFPPDLLKLLQGRLKITESQTRIYAALLVVGKSTMDEVSLYTGIPVSKAKSGIETLQENELITSLPGVIARYRAFAPYKELADEINNLARETESSWKEFQTFQKKTTDEIKNELQSAIKHTQTLIDELNERQSIALNESAMASNIALSNLAENLQKNLATLSSESVDEISTQITELQQSLNTAIDEGTKSLDENQKLAIEDANGAIIAHQDEAEQWVTTVADKVLEQTEAFSHQVKNHLQEADSISQQNVDSNLKVITTEVTTQTEGITEIIDETMASLTHNLDSYNKEAHQSLGKLNREIEQILIKSSKDVNNQIRETWTQRSQALDTTLSQITKTVQKEIRKSAQQTEKASTSLNSTIKTNHDALTQMTDTLFQELQNTLEDNGQEFQRLHKEAETTISQWPPTALTFSQFAKIKSNLAALMDQIKAEQDRISSLTADGIENEMRDIYLAQLLELQTLLQPLIKELASQQSALPENFKAIADQVGKRLKRRFSSVRKIAEVFISDFQAKTLQQKEQQQTLSKQIQKFLTQNTNTTLKSLEAVEEQIQQYSQDRLVLVQNAIQQAATENIAEATKTQKEIEKQLKSFSAAMKKMTEETNTGLKNEYEQLRNVLKQYSKEIETTAKKLREQELLRLESAITEYNPALIDIQTNREKKTSDTISSLSTHLKKREREMINDLNTLLTEAISEHAFANLDSYQSILKKKLTSSEARAAAKAQAAITERITDEILQDINSQLSQAIKTQLDTIKTQLEEVLTKEQSQYTKDSEKAFAKAREQFMEIQNQQVNALNELIAKEFGSEVNTIIRNCRTRISRQTKRNKQIDSVVQKTQEQILSQLKTHLAKEEKPVRDKITLEIQKAFQEFRKQLIKQTEREAQISSVFDSTLASLKLLPSELLPQLSDQHLSEQIIDLQSTFIQYQSSLEKEQKEFAQRIASKLQMLHEKLLQPNYAKSLKPYLIKVIKQNASEMLNLFRATLQESRSELEAKAKTSFQTNFEKQLQTSLPAKLREYVDSQVPPIQPIFENVETKLLEILREADSESKELIDKYWIPITRIVDEYAATVIGNLDALNIAIETAVDQATVNISTTLANYEDDAGNLLTATAQAFEREKTGFNEQITKGINEMREDAIGQIQESQSLLETLSKEMLTQRTNLAQKLEGLPQEVESNTKMNLALIEETAAAFLENIQTELQTLDGRVENLSKNINDLILKQSTSISNSIASIQQQLENFIKNQLPKAQTIIEAIGQNCVEKIQEHDLAITKHQDLFAASFSDEADEYIKTLQTEIIQLQTVASKLVEKIGEIGKTISTNLSENVDAKKVNIHTAIDGQLNTLDKELSIFFEALHNQFNSLEVELGSNLSQSVVEGKARLDEASAQISEGIDESQKQVVLKSRALNEALQTKLTETTSQLATQLNESLPLTGEKINKASEQLIQILTSRFNESQTKFAKNTNKISTAIDNDKEKLRNEISLEIEQMLQSFSQTLELAKTRLARASQDALRHTSEIMQNFRNTSLTNIQQRSDNVTAAIKQTIETADEEIVAQTQQTGRRINSILIKERQGLKTEYHSLTKEITTKTKTIQTTTINSFKLFYKKTKPILDRLKGQAQSTEQILTGLSDTLTRLQPTEAERTSRIISCEGIQAHLVDMFHRVNETITLVYPSFDDVPLTELGKIHPHHRVHIITTLDGEKHRANAQKLLNQGNIRIWNNPKMEFYGGSRDGEEVLIAPTQGDQGEIVAIVSNQASYISLFNQTLGPRWISASKEIRTQS